MALRAILFTLPALVLAGCNFPDGGEREEDQGPSEAEQASDIEAGSALDEQVLTVERLYGSPSLTGPEPRTVKFSPDGSRVTFLQPKPEDRTVLDLWAMDVEDGRTYQLVDARALAPDERELTEAEIQYRERARISESGVVSYHWDEAGEAVLVPLDGDIFHVDVRTGQARRLMQTEAFETDAKVSPGGRFVSFIREQNLWLHDLQTGEEVQLTRGGGGEISWGMAEFVAQEEMQRYTGYWWSPDERRIAVARVDEGPVDIVERFGISAEGVAISEQRYPRAGTDNAIVELFILDLDTLFSGNLLAVEPVEVDLGESEDIYLARVNWAKDGETVYVQRQNRTQTRLDILAADPQTGESEIVLTETSETWVNLTNDFTPLEAGGFLWTSERSGFRHIYHHDGDELRQITEGDWVVDEISGVSGDGETVYFEGWMETPLERHLYAVPFDGGADPGPVTEGSGVWRVTMGPDGESFVGTFSAPLTPPHTGLYTNHGGLIGWLTENPLDETHPYAPFLHAHIAPDYGTVTAADGETELHWMMYRPDHCTEDDPCPALIQVYGGPHVQTVTRAWQNLRDQVFAQAGYVVFKIDGRGSWNRGTAFEGALNRAMGTVEAEDQLAGLDWLQEQPFVDPGRVGLWGWSYGGYMTLMTTLQAPGRFEAGIAGAPVTDWSLYDTHYTERYMGTPQGNASGYETGSVFAHLDNYTTPLLIIHGMADDNVTFDHSTRLFAEMQERGYVFDMMTYPGQRHGIRPPELQVHLTRTMLDYLAEEMRIDDVAPPGADED